MRHTSLWNAFCAVTLTVAFAVAPALTPNAHAGMNGQPQPSADTVKRIQGAVEQFVIDGGDLGKARPDLILLIERDATADVVDLVSPALRDEQTYSALAQTFGDALEAKKDDDKTRNFVLYNLAKVHLGRARFLPVGPARRPTLEVAARAAKQIPENVRDWNIWVVRGDIEMERDDAESAAAAYRRITSSGGPAAIANYRTAVALQRGRRYPDAKVAYEAALRADAGESGGGQLFHQIAIGLGTLYQQQGNDPASLQMLARAATAKSNSPAVYRFDLNLARRLLVRGYGKEVQAYVEAALKNQPDDEETQTLLEQAKSAPRRR